MLSTLALAGALTLAGPALNSPEPPDSLTASNVVPGTATIAESAAIPWINCDDIHIATAEFMSLGYDVASSRDIAETIFLGAMVQGFAAPTEGTYTVMTPAGWQVIIDALEAC